MTHEPLQFLTPEQEAERKAFLARPVKVTRKEAERALNVVRTIYETVPKNPNFIVLERFIKGE